MRRFAAAGAALIALASALGARADGGAFNITTIDHDATIPDQRAVLVWDDGVETLVIDTRIESKSPDVAWVVPVPGVPEISASTTGLFKTLTTNFEARLATPHHGATVLLIACAMVLFVVAMMPRWLTRRRGRVATAAVILVFALMVVIPPMFGKARSVGASIDESKATLLLEGTVGSYDVAVITASSGGDAIEWLTSNGYKVNDHARRAFDDYAQRGWCFAASRLRPAADRGGFRPHPLALKFPATEPVYPLMLTGAVSDQLDVELFVLGPERAAADGFTTEFCGRISMGHTTMPVPVYTHPELKRLAPGERVITRLHAVLNREQMMRDATIAWREFAPYVRTVYTAERAKAAAAWGGAAAGAALLLPVATIAVMYGGGRWIRIAAVVCAAASIGGAGMWRAQAPVVQTKEEASGWRSYSALLMVRDEVAAIRAAGAAQSEDDLRRIVESVLDDYAARGLWQRVRRPREEDSPGNYVVDTGPEGPRLRWFLQDGAAAED